MRQKLPQIKFISFINNLRVTRVDTIFETKYSRIDQVKFVEESLKNSTWSILKYFVSFMLDTLDLSSFLKPSCSAVNPFVPKAPFLFPLKTCFQGEEKGCIGNEWIKV